MKEKRYLLDNAPQDEGHFQEKELLRLLAAGWDIEYHQQDGIHLQRGDTCIWEAYLHGPQWVRATLVDDEYVNHKYSDSLAKLLEA